MSAQQRLGQRQKGAHSRDAQPAKTSLTLQVLADALSTMATFENTFMKLSGHAGTMFHVDGWGPARGSSRTLLNPC